jgi:uncharacterized LabA/DUF88 family protein
MKTVWVVDGAYVMKSSNTLGRVDYLRLKTVLEAELGEPFFECYYLNSTVNPPTDAQDGFHTWLKCAPPSGPKMRVQLYKLKDLGVVCPQCTHGFDRQVQKGVDVGIATLVLKLAAQEQYERLVLAAGDGDFEDAIAYVKSELHKQIWIAGFSKSVSADLQSYADRVVWLDHRWSDICRLP